MAIIELNELKTSLAPGSRLLGLDLGDKTIGLALSDTRATIASPLETIRRTKFQADAARLLVLIDEHTISGLILGLPLNMNGTHGPRVQSTKAFAANLVKRTPCPIVYWDERLTTVAAERVLLAADTSRARRKVLIDKLAATYMLQGALDRLAHL